MKRTSRFMLTLACSAAAVGFGYSNLARAEEAGAKQATAQVHGAGNNKDKISGTVTFTTADDGLKVVVDIDGLTPGKHGIHIHEKTDLSDPALKGAGGHFNPDKHKHGGPETAQHHAGDLGNLTADEKGHAHLEETIKGLMIEGTHGVVGHSVVIHAKEDDLKTDPAGDSGARIAGGIIEAEKKN